MNLQHESNPRVRPVDFYAFTVRDKKLAFITRCAVLFGIALVLLITAAWLNICL